MDFMSLIWIFILFTALQPVLQKKLQEAMRQRKIDEIQRKSGSRVIVLVHRQETMSILGIPLIRYIDVQDSQQVLRVIDNTDDDTPCDFVVHTPGGMVLAAVQISRALKKHKADVRVLVPHYAMSGGTLIALAADQIVMNRHAVLGPVDPQLGQQPAASILAAVAKKPVKELDPKEKRREEYLKNIMATGSPLQKERIKNFMTRSKKQNRAKKEKTPATSMAG